MTDEEIVEETNKYPCRTVILTGGEPGLWIDKKLLDLLHQAGKIHLHRNKRNLQAAGKHRLGDLLAQGSKKNKGRTHRRSESGLHRTGCDEIPEASGKALFPSALFMQQYPTGDRLHPGTPRMEIEPPDPQAGQYPVKALTEDRKSFGKNSISRLKTCISRLKT